jgi:hypothetical protein
MREVTIRKREDGIVELAPRSAPLDPSDRRLVIATVLLLAGGLFVSGALPAAVLGAVAASCLAGEVLLGVRALALVLLRPAAEVHDVAHFRARRR